MFSLKRENTDILELQQNSITENSAPVSFDLLQKASSEIVLEDLDYFAIDKTIALASLPNGGLVSVVDAKCPIAKSNSNSVYYTNLVWHDQNNIERSSVNNAAPKPYPYPGPNSYLACPDSFIHNPNLPDGTEKGSLNPTTSAVTALNDDAVLVASMEWTIPNNAMENELRITKVEKNGKNTILYRLPYKKSADHTLTFIQPDSLSVANFPDGAFAFSWTQHKVHVQAGQTGFYDKYVPPHTIEVVGKYYGGSDLSSEYTFTPRQQDLMGRQLAIQPEYASYYVTPTKIIPYPFEELHNSFMLVYSTNNQIIAEFCYVQRWDSNWNCIQAFSESLLGKRIVINTVKFDDYSSAIVWESNNSILLKYCGITMDSNGVRAYPSLLIQVSQNKLNQYKDTDPTITTINDKMVVIWQRCDLKNNCWLYTQQYPNPYQQPISIFGSPLPIEKAYQLDGDYGSLRFSLNTINSLSVVPQVDNNIAIYWVDKNCGFHNITANISTQPLAMKSSVDAYYYTELLNRTTLIAFMTLSVFLVIFNTMYYLKNRIFSSRSLYLEVSERNKPADSPTTTNDIKLKQKHSNFSNPFNVFQTSTSATGHTITPKDTELSPLVSKV